MATLLADDVSNNEEFTSLDDLGIESQSKEVEPEVIEEAVVEDDIPEKFKGKSTKDLIAMYQESEKLIGRQGNEVGELRKVVDEFIKSQSVKKEQAEEVDELDFYENPKDAVQRQIDKHPAIQQAQEAAKSLKKADTLTRLEAKYGDVMEIVGDQNFQEWVKASKVRTQLFVTAETQFDFDAADELLDNWKARQATAQVAKDKMEAEKVKALKAADVGSKGNTEGASKKIYRRSDIIELMQKNPEKYRMMQDQILQAYAEGRVK
jgi:predicted RNA-binding protein YlqC (UPF0109 family)